MARTDPGLSIPPALAMELQAAANDEQRPADDLVREALERYLADWRKRTNVTGGSPRAQKLTPAEAAARLREQRTDNVLPDGVTMRDLMTHGRA